MVTGGRLFPWNEGFTTSRLVGNLRGPYHPLRHCISIEHPRLSRIRRTGLSTALKCPGPCYPMAV